MAAALIAKGIPLRFLNAAEVLAALRGSDLVEVGPFFGQIRLEELDGVRPDARERVQWDPIPPINRATEEDRQRIAVVEATGRPGRGTAGSQAGLAVPDTFSRAARRTS